MQLEDIRLYLMNKSQQNKLSILKVESEFCPKVCKRLHREKMSSSKWLACWSSDTKFEVKNGLQNFIVDLENRTCTCRKWDITGIPCCHAISCIFCRKIWFCIPYETHNGSDIHGSISFMIDNMHYVILRI